MPSTRVRPACDPASLDIELCWLEDREEKAEDLSSMLLVIENDIDCRFGDTGLDVLVGDTEAEKLGGEPGGVNRGVFVWDASRICGMPGLGASVSRSSANEFPISGILLCIEEYLEGGRVVSSSFGVGLAMICGAPAELSSSS